MKRILLLLFVNFLFIIPAHTQPVTQKKSTNNIGIAVAAGIQVPVGNFSSTHIAGIGIGVSPSYHTTGLFSKMKVAFTYNGGVAYYLGKKETVSSYPYTYPGYFFIHAFAGALFIPSKEITVSFTAGPALGLYNGSTQFQFGSNLALNYHLTDKVSVGPGIIFMKEPGADPLWAASLKARMNIGK
jgi:hypothetical protein